MYFRSPFAISSYNFVFLISVVSDRDLIEYRVLT